jgi:hypothetical protein
MFFPVLIFPVVFCRIFFKSCPFPTF